MISMGHRYSLVIASMTKRVLEMEMPAATRLEFLSHLETMSDQVLTPAILALVRPMDEAGEELYTEASKLGYGPSAPNFFTVLDAKFDVFATLNPSLARAYDEACRPWGGKYVKRSELAGEVAGQ
jgi:hypothetical protein